LHGFCWYFRFNESIILNINDNPSSLKSAKKVLLVALSFAVLGLALWIYTIQIQDKDAAGSISDTIAELDEEMHDILHQSKSIDPETLFDHFQELEAADRYSFFVFKDRLPIVWTDHEVGDLPILHAMNKERACLKLNNGYYLVHHFSSGDLDFYALSLIKYNFAYENNYLRNAFSPVFNLNTNPEILFEPTDESKHIALKGETLFHITKVPTKHDNKIWSYLSLIFFVVAAVLLLIGLTRLLSFKEKNLVWIPIFLIGLFLVRLIFYQVEGLLAFDHLSLFDPGIFASSVWFPSLGNFFITGVFLIFGAQFIYRWTKVKAPRILKNETLLSYGICLLLFLFYAYGINKLFKGLVEDSNISFNINNFFKLSPYSILAIIVVGFLLFSSYYLALSSQLIKRCVPSKSKANKILVVAIVLYVVFMLFMGIVDWMMILWPVALLLFSSLLIKERSNILSIRILLLALLTLYASYMFEKYSEIKTKKKLVILADKLSINNDIVAELNYQDVDKRMREDGYLTSQVKSLIGGSKQASGQLIDRYFKGYWNRYDISTYLFDSLGTNLYNSSNLSNKSKEELDRSILEASYSTAEGLYMINPEDRHLTYLTRIPVTDGTREINYDLYLELEYKFVTEELGFPELLIRGNAYDEDYSHYSVARYLDNRLISQKGSFPYLIDRNMETEQVWDSLYTKKGHLHYALERDPYAFVISKAKDTWLNKATDFTYLYTVFGLMFVLFVLMERIENAQLTSNFSLQIKIQALVISIVLISLLFFGLGSYYYIVSQNKEKNENLLREKVSSVLIELSHKLEKENAMDDDEKIAKYLTKFSNVFFTDINIYALDGHLRASSRPQLFDNGIISERMNPDAFYSLAIQKNSRFTHNEKIGNLSYLSSYVPFYGKEFEVLAYLNLPYFAKQAELEQELSAFVVAIINMLVLLFILSAFGALFVSRLITSPLKVIQDNLSGISLEKTNRPISYSGNDEIGTLVSAYNDKLDELREKAEELAQSERETAWREMAKQVAHEIKNPLTPMKLSIQYLQRAWKDKSEDWESRFNRSTATLIEQIDTLSGIATAFSDFAKMPTAQKQKIDLRAILEQVIELFQENSAGAELSFEHELVGPQYIEADKDQITRVFNNLIKNAIQSIPEDQEGQIKVLLQLKGHQFIIEVEDNGTGISEDEIDKIFVPNFTTKSTGTGLGLAMVKSIVENADGKVWFNTKVGKGTSFFVSLDKA